MRTMLVQSVNDNKATFIQCQQAWQLSVVLTLSILGCGCAYEPDRTESGSHTLERGEETIEQQADEIDQEMLEPSR